METRVSNYSFRVIVLITLFILTGCNQEDFYQKEFLDNPFQSAPDPSDTTGGGLTQGGSASGSSGGGVDGSATSGSSGGGVDGSATSGSSGGGVDGSATSGSSGGGVDGSATSGSSGGGVDGSATSGSSGGGTTGSSYGDCNQGHGNDPDHLDESNPTMGLEERCKVETFYQNANATKKLDILWVIDNSGSMADEQDDLGRNFNSFINEFIRKDVDFKMAITTTDVSSSEKKGKMVQGSNVKLTSQRAKQDEAQFMDDFKDLVRVGTRGSAQEKGLEASGGFLQRYGNSFLRNDAYLAIVILSDEEDQSRDSVNYYTDYLKSFKSDAGLLKIYSIVDTDGINTGRGVKTGSARYKLASENTAGVVANIENDFHETLSAMGDSLLNLLDSIALSGHPVEDSVQVYVNGVQTFSFTYDPNTRSVKFFSDAIPVANSEIKVFYRIK